MGKKSPILASFLAFIFIISSSYFFNLVRFLVLEKRIKDITKRRIDSKITKIFNTVVCSIRAVKVLLL
jgi:hypothetical protein